MRLRFKIGKFDGGEGLAKALDDFDRPLKIWGGLQVGRISGAFRDGGHHKRGGDKWAGLAASTLARKGPDPTILVDTGRLRNSITSETNFDGFRRASVSVGTNVSYAKFHQFGTKFMPTRKVISNTNSDINKLVKLVRAHLDRAVNGGG